MRRLRRPPALEMLPWLPTAASVVALVGLLVFALVSLRPDEPRRALPSPAATPPFLAGPGVPASPSPSVPASASVEITLHAPRRPSPTRTPPAPATPATTAPRSIPPPPPADLSGRYRTVETFDGGFIGEVLVTNSSGAARAWTVRLRFPPTIGPLRTFWVESAPQATLKQEGEVLAFSGSVPVGARASVPLRFHLDRSTPATTPQTCTVNGTRCT